MLSLVLPTFNESENLPVLLPKLDEVLRDVPHEIIIVDDDSPDETWRIAHELSHDKDHIHVIRRLDKKGLSSAVVDGFLAAKGDVLAVMDADGQHDMAVLPQLYHSIMSEGGVNIAIGSRYIEGGSVGDWDERRHFISRVATKMALALCKVKVKDPMSGFFALDRKTFEVALPLLNPKGFKILLDFLVHVPKETTVKEVPFTFGVRELGESKLSMKVQLDFIEYLYDVTVGHYIPLTFIKYCIVGGLGVGVHLAVFYTVSSLFHAGRYPLFVSPGELTNIGFSAANIVAIAVAMVFNFLLNNVWTFAHGRLHGAEAVKGFVTFVAACSVGAIINWAVSAFLYSMGISDLISIMSGIVVGLFWNYTINRMMTWKS